MKKLLSAEYYYLFRNVRFWVFVGLTFAATIGAVILCTTSANTVEDRLSYMSIAQVVIQLVIFVFSIIITLEFAHKDFSQGTMKNYVGTGISLLKVYFGKLIVCLTAVLIMSVAYYIALTVCQLIFGQFVVGLTGYKLLYLFTELLIFAVVFFICSLIRSGAIAVVVSILYTAVVPITLPMLPVDIVQEIGKYMIFNAQKDINNLLLNGAQMESLLYLHLGIETIVVVGLTILGAYLFSKKTVK